MTSSPARADAGAPKLETFRGLHYASALAGDLADVTLAPPALWDFAALGDLARAHDHHVLRLLSPSLTGKSTAQATAQEWLATGALAVEPSAGLYRWRWSQQGRSVVGVAGALTLPAPAVWPHEQVRPGLLAERAAELGTGRVQPEPILLLYDGEQPLAPGTAGPSLIDLTVTDGHHQVSVIADPGEIAGVNTALSGSSLVVADGHHRFRVLSSLPAPRPRAFVLVVDVRRSELAVGPIPRVAPGVRWETVLATPGAAVVDLDDGDRDGFLAAVPEDSLRWVVGDASRTLGVEMSTGAAAALGPSTGEECGRVARDVCYLHSRLLPLWGVAGDGVHYAHSWESARDQAAAEGGLAVASSAPRLDEVMTAARAGILLPHKATSIAPKPRAGLLMLGDGIEPRPPARR